tara:strand:- start:51 stop:359 length:309 start_codon:yes stop_codon:yes gene_type:complete
MSIDLNSEDGRKKFISESLEDLLTGINDSYGPIILSELQNRLESTISEFNEEISEAFGLLKQRDQNRKAFYKETIEEASTSDSSNETQALWEKKLEEIENNK